MASLGRKQVTAQAIVEYLKTNHWLDQYTAGVALEFATYSADVNLACLVYALWEFPIGGGAVSDVFVNWKTHRNFSTVDAVHDIPRDYIQVILIWKQVISI